MTHTLKQMLSKQEKRRMFQQQVDHVRTLELDDKIMNWLTWAERRLEELNKELKPHPQTKQNEH